MDEPQGIKALILAGSSDITVEKFSELVQTKGRFTAEELQDFYKAFKSFSHGGKFTPYAEIIFTYHPVVDPLRAQVTKKEKSDKKSIQAFFSKKTTREEVKLPDDAAIVTDEEDRTKKIKPEPVVQEPQNALLRFLKKK